MPKSILHIIPFAHLGGTEKDCLYTIIAAHEFQHQVIVLDKEGSMTQQWQNAGAIVKHLNILKLNPINFLNKFKKFLKYERTEGILYWSTIYLPLVRNVLQNKKCKMVVHVGNPVNLSNFSTIKQIITHHLLRSNIETTLFACSNYVGQTLKENHFYNKFPIEVSKNPVDLPNINPYNTSDLKIKKEIRIGMTARLDKIKDHLTLLKAFAILQSKFSSVKLWLIGDGALRPSLEKQCRELNITKEVNFLGHVTNVYEKLQNLDLFAYSTTRSEGLGNAVTEAMANGLPCVLSDLPMMHEIDANNNAAIFFRPGDAKDLSKKLSLLIQEKQLRRNLSERAFVNAKEHFSKEEYWQKRKRFLFNDQ